MKDSMSAITLNGRPLADVQAEEASNEMHEALSEAAPRISRRSAASKHTGNHSRARSTAGQIIYNAGQKAQKVRFGRDVFDWKEKAPFVPSGFSVEAGVELTEDESEACCHHCGDWFASVSGHLTSLNISPREHRRKHFIKAVSSLNSSISINKRLILSGARLAEGRRISTTLPTNVTQARRAHGLKAMQKSQMKHGGQRSREKYNLEERCKAQRLRDGRDFVRELGRTPTRRELSSYVNKTGHHTLEPNSLRPMFGSMANFFLQVGCAPRPLGVCMSGPNRHKTNEEMIDALLSFKTATGRWPMSGDMPRDNMPSRKTYARRFGGLPQAIAKAESRLIQTA